MGAVISCNLEPGKVEFVVEIMSFCVKIMVLPIFTLKRKVHKPKIYERINIFYHLNIA